MPQFASRISSDFTSPMKSSSSSSIHSSGGSSSTSPPRQQRWDSSRRLFASETDLSCCPPADSAQTPLPTPVVESSPLTPGNHQVPPPAPSLPCSLPPASRPPETGVEEGAPTAPAPPLPSQPPCEGGLRFRSRRITPFLSFKGRAYAFFIEGETHSEAVEEPCTEGSAAAAEFGGGDGGGAQRGRDLCTCGYSSSCDRHPETARFVADFRARLFALHCRRSPRSLRGHSGSWGLGESEISDAEAAQATRLPGIVWRHDPYNTSAFQRAADEEEEEMVNRCAPQLVHGTAACTPPPEWVAVAAEKQEEERTVLEPAKHHGHRRFISALAGEAAGYYHCFCSPPSSLYAVGGIVLSPFQFSSLSAGLGTREPVALASSATTTMPGAAVVLVAAASAATVHTPVKQVYSRGGFRYPADSLQRVEVGRAEGGEVTPSERPRPPSHSHGALRAFLVPSVAATATANTAESTCGATVTERRRCRARIGGSSALNSSLTITPVESGDTSMMSARGEHALELGRLTGREVALLEGGEGEAGTAASGAAAAVCFPIPEPRFMREQRKGSSEEVSSVTATLAVKEKPLTWASRLRGIAGGGGRKSAANDARHGTNTTKPSQERKPTPGKQPHGNVNTQEDSDLLADAKRLWHPPTATPLPPPLPPPVVIAAAPPPPPAATTSTVDAPTLARLEMLADVVHCSSLFTDVAFQHQQRVKHYQRYLQEKREHKPNEFNTRVTSAGAIKSMRVSPSEARYFFVLQHRCRRSYAAGPRYFAPDTIVVMDGDMGIEMGLVVSCVSEKVFHERLLTHGRATALRDGKQKAPKHGRPEPRSATEDMEEVDEAVAIPESADQAKRALVYRMATPDEITFYHEALVELESATLAFLSALKAAVQRANAPLQHGEGGAPMAADTANEPRCPGALATVDRGRSTSWGPDALANHECFKSCKIEYMHFAACEFQADGKKLYVYFYSEQPVRFLSLASFLFHIFHCRIWFHEIENASAATSKHMRVPGGFPPPSLAFFNRTLPR